MLENIRNRNKGFTIVELLIVIVVIAILAAISIVAYNGIQNRGKAAAAQSAANSITKKAEAANAAGSVGYPATVADFNAQKESELAGSGVTLVASIAAAPATPATVVYQKCSTGNTTSARVIYWDYSTGAINTSTIGINTPTACTAWTAAPTGTF